MAAEDGMAREKTADTSLSATESAPRSPKNKVNFFCSFGGKILPGLPTAASGMSEARLALCLFPATSNSPVPIPFSTYV
ncbi:unnamed protein product [Thlaspi arvense]|uniref:Uncharacterized protein n=1 Tax=Thlaspi arvense TaxID=13288 RepID=A0AAU9SKJ2_THLAR|nr:unnamed protein product [Thlaspi arvense]